MDHDATCSCTVLCGLVCPPAYSSTDAAVEILDHLRLKIAILHPTTNNSKVVSVLVTFM